MSALLHLVEDIDGLDVYPLRRGEAAMRLDLLTINVHRIIGSSWLVNSTAEERGLALILWCHSTGTQDPAGTLPDDDEQLAHLAGLGGDVRRWRRARAGALWGWRRRLVLDETDAPWRVALAHPVMTEAAEHMVQTMRRRTERRGADAERVARARLQACVGRLLGRQAREAEVAEVERTLADKGVRRRTDLEIRRAVEGLGLRVVG